MEETDEMAMIMLELEQLMRTNSVYNKINSDSNFAV